MKQPAWAVGTRLSRKRGLCTTDSSFLLSLDLVHVLRSLNMCFCSVNTSCKGDRQHHEDELSPVTLTLGAAAPSGVWCCWHQFQASCAVHFYHIQRWVVCRLAQQIRCSWRTSVMNHERSYAKKCEGPNTIFLLNLKFESLKCLNLLLRPLKSEQNTTICTDPSVFAFQKELGRCMFSVLWFQIWISNLVHSQTWKRGVFQVRSSTEIAVLSFEMRNITVHFNVMWCLLKGNR